MGSNWLRDLKDVPGLQAWRIDGKSEEISSVPKANLGVFRSDDCYILVEVSIVGDSDKPKYSAMLWIGKSTKIEENALKKLKDLEDRVQSFDSQFDSHLERQNSETEGFHQLFLFRGGPVYIEPITLKRQNNLRDEQYHRKLFKIKGKKFARVQRVELSATSLNSGDVFILDDNERIYTWTGRKANRMEKGRALDLQKRLRDERMNRCKAEIILEDEGKESEEFWNLLGGKAPIASVEEGGSDEAFEKASITEEILYRIGYDPAALLKDEDERNSKNNSDTAIEGDETSAPKDEHSSKKPTGPIVIDKVERDDILHRGMLEAESSYVLDCKFEIFVWHGSKTTGTMRQEALLYAESLQQDSTRPSWVDVTVTANGAEPGLFKVKWKGLFAEYVDTPDKFKQRLNNMNPVARLRQERVNVDALLYPEKYAAAKEEEVGNERIIPIRNPEDDDELKVYYIKHKLLQDLPADEYGYFYSENCYVIHYTLRIPGSTTRHIVYFWQGRSSSSNSRGYSAMLAAELAKNMGTESIQVRVVQNKEPDHFLSHFVDFYCVRTGKRHGWKKRQTHPVLYQIRQYVTLNTSGVPTGRMYAKAIQVRPHSTSLNNCDVFVLHDRNTSFHTWNSPGSTELEKEYAKKFVAHLAQKEEETPQYSFEVGEEDKDVPDTFWKTLPGGKGEHHQNSSVNKVTRLFIGSDRSSVFKVQECLGFTQDDLNDRTVCFLDCKTEVFLWTGSEATVRERKMATQTALDYVLAAGRDPKNCPLYMTNSSSESYHFTIYFQGWDYDVNVDDFMEALATENATPRKTGAAPVLVEATGAEDGEASSSSGLRRSLSRKKSLARQQSIRSRGPGVTRQQSIRKPGISRQVSSKNKNHSRIGGGVSSASSASHQNLDAEATELAEGSTVDGIKGTRTKTLNRQPSMMLVQVEYSKRTRNISKWNPEGIVVDFDRLKVKPTPEGVDGAHLEAFLSVEEFYEFFHTTIDTFYEIPIWKQLVIKKKVGLF